MVVMMFTTPAVAGLFVVILMAPQLSVKATSLRGLDTELKPIDVDGKNVTAEMVNAAEEGVTTEAPSGTPTQSRPTRPSGFFWTVETDRTTLSYVRRHIVGTILHSIFLSGLVICCVLGCGGICYRYFRGLPQVEKFSPN